jgi:hypothetical protein
VGLTRCNAANEFCILFNSDKVGQVTVDLIFEDSNLKPVRFTRNIDLSEVGSEI